jgi:hypothetical protein
VAPPMLDLLNQECPPYHMRCKADVSMYPRSGLQCRHEHAQPSSLCCQELVREISWARRVLPTQPCEDESEDELSSRLTSMRGAASSL